MAEEVSIKEVHDRFINMFAQIKANELIEECNVTSEEAKGIIFDACKIAMEETYEEMWGKVDEA